MNVSPVGAAFAGDPYETQFEIDGNTRVDGATGQDWDSDPATATNLNGAPFRTDEVCSEQSIPDPNDPDGTISEDSTIITPGKSIDDILIDSPPVEPGSILTKGDICSVWQASEIVQTGNEYELIFYGAWTRPNVKGEINILYPLLGPDTTTNADDLLISYDFVDSSGLTTVTVLVWDPVTETWVLSPPPAAAFEAITTRGGVAQTQDDLDPFTFGEFALNLTVAEILPQDGPCTTFTAGDPMSRTGNSQSATLKDIVGVEPLTLTNCSAITVIKETAPTNPSGLPSFTAVVDQLDGGDVLFAEEPADITAVELNLVVPTTATQTIENVLISPDYVVAETALPPGWMQTSLVCESYDPIAGIDVTVTLFGVNTNGTSFPVAPGQTAVCTIKNIGPPTVSVEKVTVGGAGGPFNFSVVQGQTNSALSAATTQADTPASAGSVVVAPGSVTVTETGVPAGFFADDLVCTLTNASGVAQAPITGAAVNGAPTGVTASVSAGESLNCVQTNLAAGSVNVTKTVTGTSEDWEFDFTISPVPAGEIATKTATASAATVTWGNLRPGVSYTVTEEPVDGYINGSVDCGQGASFTAGAGVTSTCAVTNIELADVEVTKTVQGPAQWSFDFTISPVPAGETATKAATNSDPTVNWTGLVPGTEYTITEATKAGYLQGTLVCGGTDAVGTSTFTPAPGGSVNCAITNIGTGSANVTKTVPGEANWSFDFTISPVPAGEAGTKTATSASPTAGWNNLIPGVDYTISEVVESDLVVGTMTCANGANGIGTSTFQVTPGGTTACSITNTRITDIQVTKTAGGPEVLPGGSVDWIIVVKNNGPSTALNVALVDELPSTLVLIGVTAPPAWNCSGTTPGAGGTVNCTTPDLVPGESATFTVRSVVADGLANVTIQNVAVVTTSTTETTTDNNSDQDSVFVPPLAVLPPTGGIFGMQVGMASFLLLGGIGALALGQRRRKDVRS